ncbi:MAG: ATP-binding cassette domain-containing protein [Candidatus Eisenbacteria bacterium]
MAMLSLNDVSLTFSGPPLLDGVNLQIDEGERLGLLGRNGAGKSTLLKILEGTLAPDSGEVVRQPRLRVAGLQQDVPLDLTGSVRDYLHEVCGVTTSHSSWEIETRIDQAAHGLSLDLDVHLETLSAGSKRRVLLAAALVRDPDVLILDEPTNHLDIDAIEHLEGALQRRRGALIFVTHDRRFLSDLATRILDLDRGTLRSYRVRYDAYLAQREEELRVEGEQAALFDKKLAQEEAWLRQGIKARRTRNEGRVRALESLRLERGARREEAARVKAQLQEADRSGRKVLRCEGVGYAFGDTPIVRDFTTTILRGDRIGILGPNGCGKTTLIRLLLGELEPQQGTVIAGTKLDVAHYEQLHDVLDEGKSVRDNIGEGREVVTMGSGERHVVGYLRDFLFTPEQIQGPVTRLSGGERKRLQLAKILSRPCNLLVLDEPTNDLDLETLELLEDLLMEFEGTLLVVSHDRAFLDNVVTSTLVWEGGGEWREYVGGYEDWLRQTKAGRRPGAAKDSAGSAKAAKGAGGLAGAGVRAGGNSSPAAKVSTGPLRPAAPGAERSSSPRAGTKERRELGELTKKIETLEAERQRLFDCMALPEFYSGPGAEIARARQDLAALEATIQKAYARWLELESLTTRGER